MDLITQLADADLSSSTMVVEELPPLTLSADVRNSGYKLAPVDVNLFPAGWHNLCHGIYPRAAEQITRWCQLRGLAERNVLILGEFMTRNPSYLENLATIEKILTLAGYEVRLGLLAEDETEPIIATTLSEQSLQLYPVRVEAGRLVTSDGFRADWVLNNNDFTGGAADLLASVDIPIEPSPRYGWHARRKRDFYSAYEQIATAEAERLSIDPWTLIPETVAVEPVDFWNKEGVIAVADQVDAMLDSIADHYRERNISDSPFVVVKDEAGTFGMGVLTLDSSDSLRNLNRKTRQKMQRGKGGRSISSVLVQEGVYTRDIIGECVAEPVVMAIGGRYAGGFFRYHCSKTESDNLNSKGMVFARLCGSDGVACGDDCVQDPARDRLYGWIANTIAHAAGRELAAL